MRATFNRRQNSGHEEVVMKNLVSQAKSLLKSGPRRMAGGGRRAAAYTMAGLAVAVALLTQVSYADLVVVLVNGVPYGPGQSVSIPAGVQAHYVKVPNEDLGYFVYDFVAPPAPPKTYRVVSADGTVTDLGDGSKGKPKQVGSQVVIDYGGGETVTFNGTLISPGQPNPAPAPVRNGTMLGPSGTLQPSVALADAEEFLTQPELSWIFPAGIDLSYIQYDFSGTTPFPVFVRDFDIAFTDGTSFTYQVVPAPEPTTLLLLGSGITGLGGVFRRRLHHRG
jgi:PEP-CTERM motif